MLDFKELGKDGKEFELLIRELLFTKGYKVYWSGVGPDGGRDLLCVEERPSFFSADKKVWLIQCKHNAHSGNSVGIEDLDNIVDSCTHHGASGYILACSTQPSSTVVNRLENITKNPVNAITAIFWDYVFIEQALSNTNLWRVAQRFFPVSAESTTWKVYATESPNHWVVTYKGYYFHLANRIGSNYNFHFNSIEQRITDIESVKLPQNHFIRIRSIYYDDKGGAYTWYLDYMYPSGERPEYSSAQIKYLFGHEDVLDDGQFYFWDVKIRAYMPWSDHYDPDHYDFYVPHIQSYLHGTGREGDYEHHMEALNSDADLQKELEAIRTETFNKLVKKLSETKCLEVIRACNARMEHLAKFHHLRDWTEEIESMDYEIDRFFSAWFMFRVLNNDNFSKLVSIIPQNGNYHFRLTKPYIYIPDGEKNNLSEDDGNQFELTLFLNPTSISDKVTARENINKYFELIIKHIDKFIENEKEKINPKAN